MNYKFIIVIVVLASIGWALFFFLQSNTSGVTDGDGTLPVTDRNESLVPEVDVLPDRDILYPLQLPDGSFISVETLVLHPDTNELVEGFYETSSMPETYGIYYHTDSYTIYIHLYNESLSLARNRAERTLLDALSLSREEVCRLHISVTTNPLVSREYSDRELGLSFCPNHVPFN